MQNDEPQNLQRDRKKVNHITKKPVGVRQKASRGARGQEYEEGKLFGMDLLVNRQGKASAQEVIQNLKSNLMNHHHDINTSFSTRIRRG